MPTMVDYIAEHLPPITVWLSCKDVWVPETDIEVVGIQEDPAGRDLVAFYCPKCGKLHESLRRL